MKKVIKPARIPARNRNPAQNGVKVIGLGPAANCPKARNLRRAPTNSQKPPISCPMLPSSYFPRLGPAPGRYVRALEEDLLWQMKPQGQRPETGDSKRLTVNLGTLFTLACRHENEAVLNNI